MAERHWTLADADATVVLGMAWADALAEGLVIYLRGELGAGKTTFARALLEALGVRERVKSPTYSLVERYDAGARTAWHLDLYRIADPQELHWLGLDGLSDDAALVLIEWPERGAGSLPDADVELRLGYAGEGRVAHAVAASERGGRFLRRLE